MPTDALIDPVITEYLAAIVTRVRATFADRTRGVYAIGSLAYGGFGPDSDVDVIAVVDPPIDPADAARLGTEVVHPNLACPMAGLEFVVYPSDEVADPRGPIRWALNVNGGLTRASTVSTDPTSEAWHWFVLDLAIGRATAIAIDGPPLDELVGPVPRDLQLDAIRSSVRWHDEFDAGRPNQLANAARGLQYVETGRWTSKPDALAWLARTGRPAEAAPALLATALGVDDDQG